MNPFLVLGVPPDADDAAIRSAYLKAIKVSTPESDPARFKELVAAYECVKDESSRIQRILFNQDCPAQSPLDAFLRHTRSAPPAPLPIDALKDLLRTCAKP